MKLAVDFGNSNLKFAGEVGGAPVYKVVRSLATRDAIDNNYVVEHGGKTLYFGVGDSLVRADKTDREYIKESIMLGFYEIYGASDKVKEIDLALGLPLDLYKSSKKADFEDKVKKLTNTILDGAVNGEDVLIKVKTIKICAEGYSAFLNLLPVIDKDYPALIVDIGYGTTDYLGVSVNPSTGKWQIDDNDTVNKGMYDVYDTISKDFLNKEKLNLSIETIEHRILNKKKVLTKTGEVDMSDYLSAGSVTAKDIFNKIEKKFTDMETRKIYIIGGGARLIDTILGDSVAHKQLVDQNNSLYANALGYLLQIK